MPADIETLNERETLMKIKEKWDYQAMLSIKHNTSQARVRQKVIADLIKTTKNITN